MRHNYYNWDPYNINAKEICYVNWCSIITIFAEIHIPVILTQRKFANWIDVASYEIVNTCVDLYRSQSQCTDCSSLCSLEIQSNAASSQPTTSGRKQPTNAERKNPLLSDAAQSVLAMGYLPRIVKMAVDKVLQSKGNVN